MEPEPRDSPVEISNDRVRTCKQSPGSQSVASPVSAPSLGSQLNSFNGLPPPPPVLMSRHGIGSVLGRTNDANQGSTKKKILLH